MRHLTSLLPPVFKQSRQLNVFSCALMAVISLPRSVDRMLSESALQQQLLDLHGYCEIYVGIKDDTLAMISQNLCSVNSMS